MLTEFAKFTQSRVPVMLGEFVRYKKILEAEPQALLRSIHRLPKARIFDNMEGINMAEEREGTTTEQPTTIMDTTIMETTMMETTTPAATTTPAETTTPADTTTTTPASVTTTPDDMDEQDEIERNIEEAIENILNAIKETFNSFKESPLSIATLQSIGNGVIKGVKLIAAEFGYAIPGTLPDLPNVDLPDVHLPDISLPDISLPEIPELGPFNLADWPWICKVIWWPHDDDHCASMRCAACGPSMMAASRACELGEGRVSHFCLRRVLGEGVCNYCAVDYIGY